MRKTVRYVWILVFVVGGWMALCERACAADSAEPDTCLAARATNLADNLGQATLVVRFDSKGVVIRPGDRLEYDIYLSPSCPVACGGIDVTFKGGGALRRSGRLGVKDQNGLDPQGDTLLTPAVGKWYHRVFDLDPLAGKKTAAWCVVFHGAKIGFYTQFLDNILIAHGDGTKTVVYDNGFAPEKRIVHRRSYSRSLVLAPVLRDAVVEGADIDSLMAPLIERQETFDRMEGLTDDVRFAETLLKHTGRDTFASMAALHATSDSLVAMIRDRSLSEAAARKEERDARHVLDAILKPVARHYTGYLVGHAHIDAQWLWEWPETVQELHNTFGQALRFMDEFHDFTFSQSSAMYYQQTEYEFPDLFREIQKRVKEGRWELVGGRMTEADTNLISPEAHVREFLYGQRFFRERFRGKQAVVAWEPDTFGHNAQMPQIVKLGGCDYYYFCRAGKNYPLFQWEGLDGTRILAFQEVNSWYNDALSPSNFDELISFEKKTGSRDMMWVYGVGDHGGGPTREDIQEAVGWQKKSYLPKVKFSTATDFFKAVEKSCDISRLPVVKGELNFVFRGCYTTHGNIKRWNDDAEALAESSESLAAVAARYGFPYPGTLLRRDWEDICWNQHHDTIDGSAVNAAYRRSREVEARAMANSRLAGSDALGALAERIEAPKGAVVVFNPVGCVRDAEVECVIPKGKRPGGIRAVGKGDSSGIQLVDRGRRVGIFVAHRLPSYGYRVYEITDDKGGTPPDSTLRISPDGRILENANLRVEVDPTSGTIVRILDKRTGREFVPAGGSMGRLEIHWEEARGASAWNIGKIDHVDVLGHPIAFRIVEKGPERVAVEWTYRFRKSRIVQRVGLREGGDSVDCRVRIGWKETSSNGPRLCPFLKVAFDLNIPGPTANYEIPFGAVARPMNGDEVPALKWVDISNNEYGMSVLCDSKHGWSATTDTLRLSLVRTPTWPDPTSDDYPQRVRYALVPHSGSWKSAGTVGRGFAFVHPVWTMTTTRKCDGPLPRELSFVSSPDPNVMITAVKRAEDDNDLVVRLYESSGRAGLARVRTGWDIEKASTVNFLEDPMGEPATPRGDEVRFVLRPYEIKTLKLKLKPVRGVEMTGTRGSGPPRSF